MAPVDKVAAASPRIALDSLDLSQAERTLATAALARAGDIAGAAQLLGITRLALRRLVTKHRIAWPPKEVPPCR